VTVSPAAASAIWAAAAGAIQGAGLANPGDGGTLYTLAQTPAVIAALGATPAASAVAEMVAAGNIASHARLTPVRYFTPNQIRSWK
jgi:hypothetical protein